MTYGSTNNISSEIFLKKGSVKSPLKSYLSTLNTISKMDLRM